MDGNVYLHAWCLNEHILKRYIIHLQDHFEKDQYECGRVDGLKRLRANAVPTKFVYVTSYPKERKPPRKRNLSCAGTIDPPAKRVCDEHSYSKPVEAPGRNESEYLLEKGRTFVLFFYTHTHTHSYISYM